MMQLGFILEGLSFTSHSLGGGAMGQWGNGTNHVSRIPEIKRVAEEKSQNVLFWGVEFCWFVAFVYF